LENAPNPFSRGCEVTVNKAGEKVYMNRYLAVTMVAVAGLLLTGAPAARAYYAQIMISDSLGNSGTIYDGYESGDMDFTIGVVSHSGKIGNWSYSADFNYS
jgi:hypothetical protein